MANVTTLDIKGSDIEEGSPPESVVALVLLWSSTDPRRVGEALFVPAEGEAFFGRGGAVDGEVRAELTRQRPGRNEMGAGLENPFLSRKHLCLRADGAGVRVTNLGKRPLLHQGTASEAAPVLSGDTIEIQGQALFLCATRRRVYAPCRNLPADRFPTFGGADAHGLVGEGPPAWELRDRCALAGSLSAHALLLGESGTGKELAARAIHAQSSRRTQKLVARNAATFPPGLIDAELFGNVANYPNAGMPERRGVIGEADGSTLFLDEIAELSGDLQSHLLRVLDEGGEYQRLGEAHARRADVRVIAATNRPVQDLKHDLAARLSLRIELVGLNDRREDIPLIARDLLLRRARKDAPIGARFFAGWDGKRGDPRLSPALVRALVTHHYTTHARELDALLMRSLMTSPGASFELTEAVRAEISAEPRGAPAPTPAQEYTREQIKDALDKHGGVRERVWRELGMANRYVLQRLLKKHGLGGADADDDAV
jgi:two-component system nitrogen regulation response regulator GlnG/two-component system response regulator HydG